MLNSFWVIWAANKIDLKEKVLQIIKENERNKTLNLP